jgi:transcriptional regulator with XRE-family HTH domain
MHKQNKEYKIKIGANVRLWRNLRGLKQKDLAEKVDYSESTISNIENDSLPPTLHQMEDIAAALQINIIQLFSEPKVINNTFNESPHSVGNIETQQNHTDKEVLQIMLERMDKKDEQTQTFMKDIVNSITSLFKKEAS